MAASIWAAVVIAMPNAALPVIESDLDLSATGGELSWTLAFAAVAAVIVPAGQLADRFGRERTLLVGVGAMAVLCLVAGLTSSGSMFLGIRFLQGAASAIIFAPATGIVNVLFPDPVRRGTAFGVFGLAFGLGLGLGPVYGAVFDDWRWAFFTSVLILVAMGLGVRLTAPMGRGTRGASIDVVGAVLLGIGLTLFIIATDQGRTWGWLTSSTGYLSGETDPEIFGVTWGLSVSIVPVMIGLSLVSFIAFALIERTAVRRGRAPLFEMRFFAAASYRLGVISASLLFFGMLPLFVVLPMVSQVLIGQDALQMSLTVAPVGIGAAVGGLLSAPIGRRIGSKWTVVVGLGASAAATLLMIPFIDVNITASELATIGFLSGIAIGIAYARVTEFTLVDIEPASSAHASGLMFSLRSTAGALGTVILAGVITVVVVHATPFLSAVQADEQVIAATDLAARVAGSAPAATSAGEGMEIAQLVESNPIVTRQLPSYVDGFKLSVGLAAAAFGIAALVAMAAPGSNATKSEEG